jgi:chaperonin GroES
MKAHMLEDRVLVEPLDVADQTEGGIVIPDTAKDKATRGLVVEVGPGRSLESGGRLEPQLKPGVTVVYSKYAGDETKIEGKKYLILRERDVFFWIED